MISAKKSITVIYVEENLLSKISTSLNYKKYGHYVWQLYTDAAVH